MNTDLPERGHSLSPWQRSLPLQRCLPCGETGRKTRRTWWFLFTPAASANLDGVLARTVRFHSSVLAVSANCRFDGIRCWAPGYASTTRIGRQIDRPLAE